MSILIRVTLGSYCVTHYDVISTCVSVDLGLSLNRGRQRDSEFILCHVLRCVTYYDVISRCVSVDLG
jgi:hypothetical protein